MTQLPEDHLLFLRILSVVQEHSEDFGIGGKCEAPYRVWRVHDRLRVVIDDNDFLYWGASFCTEVTDPDLLTRCYPHDRRFWALFDAAGPKRDPTFGNPFAPGQHEPDKTDYFGGAQGGPCLASGEPGGVSLMDAGAGPAIRRQ